MATHHEVTHEGLKYHCQGCDFETNSKKNLSAQYYSIHLGRKFECEECGKEFGVKGNLKKHQYMIE
jgi:predicted RNA-binding Zn-ribbon protein involved in translation (DUF1610 family)